MRAAAPSHGYIFDVCVDQLQTNFMKNSTRITFAGAFALALIVFACQKETVGTSSGASKLSVYLTDHPTPVFDSVFIDLQKLEVKIEDSASSNGWITVAINPGVYNILRLRNGIDTLFANGILPGNRLRKLRLTLGSQNSVMKNGQSFPLIIHDKNREVLANLDESNFEIQSSGQILFWIDFDVANSITTDNSGPGNNNGFELKPHIRIFTKSKSGRIEGKVLPRAADPIIMAINGADTATAIPEDHDGEFKIVGLNAGSYKIFIDGQNGYSDTTITNVVVRKNEDTHLVAITLHK
jgi:hypothetical protein